MVNPLGGLISGFILSHHGQSGDGNGALSHADLSSIMSIAQEDLPHRKRTRTSPVNCFMLAKSLPMRRFERFLRGEIILGHREA
jgi:hypothetical protein